MESQQQSDPRRQRLAQRAKLARAASILRRDLEARQEARRQVKAPPLQGANGRAKPLS